MRGHAAPDVPRPDEHPPFAVGYETTARGPVDGDARSYSVTYPDADRQRDAHADARPYPDADRDTAAQPHARPAPPGRGFCLGLGRG